MTGGKISIICGRVWKLGDDCDTGQIIPGRYVPLTDPQELAIHLFEDVAPDFRKKISPGDIIVAGRSFGTGSSREHAPKAVKFSGIAAVVADSFARIFYRNALNIGLLAIPIPGISQKTENGNMLEIDVYQGRVTNRTKKSVHEFVPYDPFIIDMLEAGGIVQQTINWLKNKRL
jgi:3-isopropylmalate/(R)-2-methylmalate dehydratase small subunit